ncbi:MAG TPA: DUF1648 domain-containing protein [Nocardioides sp.]
MARVTFWVTVLAHAGVCTVGWFVLPERVPLHFAGSGEVDRWGSRPEAVLTMALVGAGMALLFWALANWVPRAPETLLNINERDKKWWLSTPDRTVELRRRLSADLFGFGAATMLLLIVVELITLGVARDEEPSMTPWIWLALGIYLVGVLGACVHLATRRYRTPRVVT